MTLFYNNRGDNMTILNRWEVQVCIYLLSSTIFVRAFKSANRDMKDASCLTVLLELFTALFAILLIPFFEIKFPSDPKIYLILLITTVIYAITDRLNLEARYGLNPSTFSMLKQLSTVFMIIFGIVFLKEAMVPIKILGALLIISSNLLISYNHGKFEINKYFIMCFFSNFLFAVAMLINVNISDYFNLAIYTIMTVSVPALIISIVKKLSFKKLKDEFMLYKKREFILAGATWCLMLISSVRAYQLQSVTIVAPLFALTALINATVELIFDKDRERFLIKIIAGLLIIAGVILIKL